MGLLLLIDSSWKRPALLCRWRI